MPEGSSRRRVSSASGRELAAQNPFSAFSCEREARQVDKGRDAARVAVEMANLLEELL